jgi:hypothetical protein
VLVAVALVVQASTGGVCALCPDLIHHQLSRSSFVWPVRREMLAACKPIQAGLK